MMRRLVFLSSFLVVCLFFQVGPKMAIAKTKVHPRNRLIISKGLVPASILKYFPEVPKITPKEAYVLYRKHKAIFVAIGHDAPRLSGGWLLKDYMQFNPKRLHAYQLQKKKMYIILYCG